jgi:hypothetical protein
MIVDRHYLNFVLVTLAEFGYLNKISYSLFKFSGTTPGGNDVYAFENIGVVQHKALHHLSLQNGYHYYATLKGNTFVFLAEFGYLVNRSFGFIAPKILNYLALQSFAIEHT